MITYDDLGHAASDLDAIAREHSGNGVSVVADVLDVHLAGLVEAAKQRAMRMIVVERGPAEQARLREQNYANMLVAEDFSDAEIEKLLRYQAVCVDALVIGIRTAQQKGS